MPVRPIGQGRFVPESRAAGLPDLILIHEDPPRIVLAEVKRRGGILSEEQVEFLRLSGLVAAETRMQAGRLCPVGSYVWMEGRDEDMIETILKSKVMVAP